MLIVFTNGLRVTAADFSCSADEGCGFVAGNNVRDARSTLSADEVRVSLLMLDELGDEDGERKKSFTR